MLQMIDEGEALNITSKYYSLLSKTGYVKHESVLRFLVYIFLLDLVDYTHAFFEEEDYKTIDRALNILFSNGGCLLPYPVFCANRAVLGRNEFMGTRAIRKTEDATVDADGNFVGYEDRYTEDEQPRII